MSGRRMEQGRVGGFPPWWRGVSTLAAVALAVATSLPGATARGQQPPSPDRPPPVDVTHGVASGDVTSTSAVIWARASRRARMRVEYRPRGGARLARAGTMASSLSDYTSLAPLRALQPDTVYRYRVWFSLPGRSARSGRSRAVAGAFRTAPSRSAPESVGFVFGGDLGGSRYCRRRPVGYPILSSMRALRPAFFVANGDMIYADQTCPPEGPDGPGGWENVPGDFVGVGQRFVDWTNAGWVREIFRRHWRYNRADEHFQALLRGTPMYAQWDDHEVLNDSGASWTHYRDPTRPGYPTVAREGRKALFDWSPIRRRPGPDRIFRSAVWGRDLELFLLDTRSYRSRNELPDTPENAKTLLGPDQVRWFKRGLARSEATWKVVSSSVSISVPTAGPPFGRDGWASGEDVPPTGFERELLGLLRFMDSRDVRNVVFVATDVHFAQTTRHAVDADGDGDQLVFHEVLTGPLSAQPFSPRPLDPTSGPTSLYAEAGFFNFGYVRVRGGAGRRVDLIADVRDEGGAPRPGSRLRLSARRR